VSVTIADSAWVALLRSRPAPPIVQ